MSNVSLKSFHRHGIKKVIVIKDVIIIIINIIIFNKRCQVVDRARFNKNFLTILATVKTNYVGITNCNNFVTNSFINNCYCFLYNIRKKL